MYNRNLEAAFDIGKKQAFTVKARESDRAGVPRLKCSAIARLVSYSNFFFFKF